MDRISAMMTFVKVVEAGSLSAAARELNLSRASVSRMIDSLEEHLRIRLLVRTTRHLAPTDDGRTYYEQAKRILAAVDEAEDALSARRAAPSGRLTLASPVYFGRLYVAPLLPDFLARYPEVTIDLLLVDRVVNQVEEGVDIAIRMGPLEDSSLIIRNIGQARRIVCAAPAYLQRRGEPKEPQDLEHHDCLVNTWADGTGLWHFHSAQGELHIPVKGRLCTNSFDSTLLAALAGVGVVTAPFWAVHEHLVAGRLVQVLEEFEMPDRPIYAVFPHLRLLSTKVRVFLDYLAERLVLGVPS